MSEMRILYLADPNSIHDVKWMMPKGPSASRFLILRKLHYRASDPEQLRAWSRRHGIEILGSLEDFSVVRFGRTLHQAWKLRTLLRNERIEVLHIQFAEPNALWAVFRKFLGIPIIVTTRGTDVLKTIPRFFARRDPLSWVISRLYRFAFGQVDAITSTSSSQIQAVATIAPGAREQTHLIRTGIDFRKIRADSSHCTIPTLKARPFVFFPRVMKPLYRHEFAIEAIALLPAELRDRFLFVFVGRDGGDQLYAETIQHLMEKTDARFEFLNLLDQTTLHQCLKDASLVVMTPRSDGSSVTAVEAMVCRTPLILPPLDYDTDLFGRGGFFFEHWKPQSLANKMIEVLTGNWEYKLELGYQDAISRFDRTREMGRLWALYQRLLKQELGEEK